MRLIFVITLLINALPATAQIYQYTDAKGHRAYTDRPPLDVKANSVELPSINTVSDGQQHSVDTSNTQPTTTDAIAPYSTLQVAGLPDEEALRANNGNFIIHIEIAPTLSSEHRLQLLINDQPYGSRTSSIRIAVQNLERGEHRIAVQVLAGDQVIQTSAEHTLAIQRVHTASPAFRARPTPLSAP